MKPKNNRHFSLVMLLVLTAAASPAFADILLGGPGVPAGAVISNDVPFKYDFQLTNSYKFVMTGLEAKGDTLGNSGTGDNKQFHLQATVYDNNTSKKERTDSLYFRDIADYNASPLQTLIISPSVVFKAENNPITIFIEWSGQGSAKKATGIFNILGEYQKDPPKPVGTLRFLTGDFLLLEAGIKPEGVATITRE
ncbi:MAG TPA: hypothetical protein DDZ88_18005 [Verrucomicrobiales bacterium]|nr:hypothetical protein [Verrucomicrobiales bacterium]